MIVLEFLLVSPMYFIRNVGKSHLYIPTLSLIVIRLFPGSSNTSESLMPI